MLMFIISLEIVLIQSLCLLSLIVLCIGSLLIQPTDAILEPQSNVELYVENEVILVGFVTSISVTDSEDTQYTINVERYVKNPQEDNSIVAIGRGSTDSKNLSSIDKLFKMGDRVLLFLNTSNDIFLISPYSVNAQLLDVDADFLPPPLRLYKAEVPVEEISCKQGMSLLIKATNDFPACIKQNSIEKLVTRGWGKLLTSI